MPRASLWTATNWTNRAVLQTPVRALMERNGSFVSGYLWEIVPSAKEPRKDLHTTQNSSEARPKDFLPLRDSPLPGEVW